MKPNDVNPETVKPWYRQFWAWFVLTPLIVVVVVSSITVTIAVRYADDRVLDNYYKEGRMINMRLEEDLLAHSLSVTAAMHFDRELQALVLTLTQRDQAYPPTLILELSHPAQQELDHQLKLTRIADNRYYTELTATASPLNHRWYLRLLPQLENPDQPRWRLRGEIDFADTDKVVLKSSVEG